MTIVCQDELKDHLRSPATTITTCWLVKWVDGTILGFTSLNRNLTFDLEAWMISQGLAPIPGVDGTGSVDYIAMVGYRPSDIAGSSDLSPENLEVYGLMSSPSITPADLNAGKWDFAAVTIFVVNYEDLTMGALIMRAGTLGEVTLERDTFKAEFRGVSQAYSRIVGRLLSPQCSWTLGDSNCGVLLAAAAWQSTHVYIAQAPGFGNTGDLVAPSSYDGFWYLCTTGGTSGGTEPTWNASLGATTNDGSVVWTAVYARSALATVTGVNSDNQTFTVSGLAQPGPTGGVNITGITQANPGVVSIDAPLTGAANGSAVTIAGVTGMTQVNGDTFIYNYDSTALTFELGIDTTSLPAYAGGGTVVLLGGVSGFFDYGVATWTNGNNANLAMEVKSYVPGQVTLQLPMPYQITAGDIVEMQAGCAKAFVQDCKTKYGNWLKFGGFPYLPGIDRVIQVGKQL